MRSVFVRTPVLVLLAAVFVLASCSQFATKPPRPAQPTVDLSGPDYTIWPHDASDIAPDPAVRYGVLANGMRYALMRNVQPAGTVSLRLRIAAGSLQETDAQRGLAHFMEHMAFNGSQNVPEGEYVKLLQRKGLAFGAHTNAYTSTGETVYKLELPKNDADLVDTGLMLFREIGDRLTLDPKSIEREKGVVLSEQRTRNTPEFRAFEARWRLWYEGQRLADRMPIGTAETIQGATRELLADYYARFYRPERTLLVVTGDFDPAEIEAKIKAKFADWQAAGPSTPDPDAGPVKERGLTAASLVEPNLSEEITVTWFQPPEDLPDTEAGRELNTKRNIAFAIINRRLERIARAPKAPFVSAEVDYSNSRHISSAAGISVSVRPGQWPAAVRAVEQEVRRALEHGFHQSEVDREIKSLRANLEDAIAKSGTRRTPALANAITSQFASFDVFSHPRDGLARFEKYAGNITATVAHEALRDLIRGQGPIVFVSAGQPVRGGDAAIAAIYEASRKMAVKPSDQLQTKEFPYTDFGAPGTIKERAEIADIGATTLRFANGVMLNVKQTDFEKDTIHVAVRFAGGYVHLPRDKVGLSWVLPFGFSEGGLTQLTTEELEEALTGRIVSTDLDIDDDAFEFGGRTNARDLGLQMQLMAAFATDPAYRANGVKRFQDAAENFLKQYSSSPGGVLQRELGTLVRSGDPRWTFPKLAQIQALKIDDVKATMSPVLDAAPVEITMVGDVSVDDAVKAVAATFGALKPRAAKLPEHPEARAVRFPTAARQHRFTHEGKSDQAVAYAAWPAPDFYSSPKRARTISLLREMLKVRLTDEFREAQGATYSPSAGNSHSGVFPDFGFIAASAETKPELIESFYATLDKIIAERKSGAFSEDLITRARTPILKSIETDRRANGYWFGAIDDLQTEPRGLAAIRSQMSDVETITKADLVAVAQKYLDNTKRMEIRVLPKAVAATKTPGKAGKLQQPPRTRAAELAFAHD
ncbi:MAG: insulinase family protein [Micropepsaceae bacterium]